MAGGVVRSSEQRFGHDASSRNGVVGNPGTTTPRVPSLTASRLCIVSSSQRLSQRRCKDTPFPGHAGIFFLPYEILFVLLHLLSRAKAVSKKSIAIWSLSPNSPKFKQEDEHQCLRLLCMLYTHSISSGVRDVPHRPVPVKAFGDAW